MVCTELTVVRGKRTAAAGGVFSREICESYVLYLARTGP